MIYRVQIVRIRVALIRAQLACVKMFWEEDSQHTGDNHQSEEKLREGGVAFWYNQIGMPYEVRREVLISTHYLLRR